MPLTFSGLKLHGWRGVACLRVNSRPCHKPPKMLCHCGHVRGPCNSALEHKGQEKHGLAAHRQGALLPASCEGSPRALGQRVPLGDQQATSCGALQRGLLAEHMVPGCGPLQQHSNAVTTHVEGGNRTGLTLSMPLHTRRTMPPPLHRVWRVRDIYLLICCTTSRG